MKRKMISNETRNDRESTVDRTLDDGGNDPEHNGIRRMLVTHQPQKLISWQLKSMRRGGGPEKSEVTIRVNKRPGGGGFVPVPRIP